jgi:hypothetical protein
VPISPGMLAQVPLVSVAGFKAHPTYLDLQNLRSGVATLAAQDSELNNILLQASSIAEGEEMVGMPLQAHIQTDSGRATPDRRGRLFLYPDHKPVRALLSYSYSAQIGSQTVVATPAYRLEDNRQIIVELGGSATSWSGSLQLGAPRGGIDLYTDITYVAGYANTILGADAAAAAQAVTVRDPTGIYPGDVLRLWDPGVEEQVIVAANYTPIAVYPPAATSIPLVAPLANAHTAGAHISSLPPDAYNAVVYLAIDALARPGSSDPQWPGSKVPAATAKRRKQAARPWFEKAKQLLSTYQDVW